MQSASEQREGKPQVCGKRGGLLREMRDERVLQALSFQSLLDGMWCIYIIMLAAIVQVVKKT